MNGDEDLGADITMKGQKFHYNQELVQVPTLPTDYVPAAPFKADNTGYTFPDKVHTIDPKAAKTHTGFYAQRT